MVRGLVSKTILFYSYITCFYTFICLHVKALKLPEEFKSNLVS